MTDGKKAFNELLNAIGPLDLVIEHEGATYALVRGTDGIPRVRDLEFGRWMELQRPRDIRSTIKTHLPSLGVVSRFRTAKPSGSVGGRPEEGYELTEEQALYIAAKSETPKAAALLKAMIYVFMLARRGQLAQAQEVAQKPLDAAPAESVHHLQALNLLREELREGREERRKNWELMMQLAQKLAPAAQAAEHLVPAARPLDLPPLKGHRVERSYFPPQQPGIGTVEVRPKGFTPPTAPAQPKPATFAGQAATLSTYQVAQILGLTLREFRQKYKADPALMSCSEKKESGLLSWDTELLQIRHEDPGKATTKPAPAPVPIRPPAEHRQLSLQDPVTSARLAAALDIVPHTLSQYLHEYPDFAKCLVKRRSPGNTQHMWDLLKAVEFCRARGLPMKRMRGLRKVNRARMMNGDQRVHHA